MEKRQDLVKNSFVSNVKLEETDRKC
ncbi:hypothetical protein NTGBS_160029 [Candidatus Nitrotoga sp. BS]|nr:hypothetical protein NTGBS_160029 [Candidatus Nitrotoga sp. BS]